MDKERLRVKLQKCLLEMGEKERSEKSQKACRNLVSTPQFQSASTVMMYLSLPHEVDTSEVVLYAWQLGKTVVVPKISWQQRHMIPVQINSLETGFSTEVAGLRNPVTGVPTPIEEIDLVVAPALGFDRKGNRLGRGASFYDRFFANEQLKATRCGFAFAEQLVDSVPVEERDEPVDFLVTDKEVLYFNSDKENREKGE
ncbi:MAG: 5-formyltetrahydrofolate cyclo-ligase [Phycisphaerae bacterium]|nr:5-formyltetrahydrofolate cyclo-ligase [Phycisphaerae bacterium]NIP55294.1 5-formyltetrahydrofolate cyclo-ligase [Phycisphaerae bacterium]NIS53967.1 5-formyltetrahydrofolate cyclo-ligase [Phycisphaerae bacterium]NIU11575.1 5-formyltetrahydrofolate cyclo-ligase [Phycisphaerae bacterium]NIU59367.1 5-formyltetrahydrofolate cyclo-ligase [Phycisphaerae bacterium]